MVYLLLLTIAYLALGIVLATGAVARAHRQAAGPPDLPVNPLGGEAVARPAIAEPGRGRFGFPELAIVGALLVLFFMFVANAAVRDFSDETIILASNAGTVVAAGGLTGAAALTGSAGAAVSTVAGLAGSGAVLASGVGGELTVDLIGGNILFNLVIVFALTAAFAVRGFPPVRFFGLNRQGPLKILVLGLAGGIAAWLVLAYGTYFIVEVLLDQRAEPQTLVDQFMSDPDPLKRGMIIAAAVLAAPLYEETVFRGILYPVIRQFTGRAFGLAFSALVFAAVHLHVTSLAPMFLLGIFLCLAYDFTRCLWVPMAIHACFNAITVGGMLFLSEHPEAISP